MNMDEAVDVAGGADAEAYRRAAAWPLADFECEHGRLGDCPDCEAE